MLKRLSIVLLLSTILFVFFFTSPVKAADSTWYNQSYGEWSTKVFDNSNPTEIFGERYTYAQVLWITYSLTHILSGTDLSNCLDAYNSENLNEFKDCVNSLQSQNNVGPAEFFASVGDYVEPYRLASGISYASNQASNLHIIPQASAQGFGFTTLQPIQNIWRAVRNISYFLLILFIVVLSFMIMFRVKLSPQTVITIQSAIPKIVITLLLITFSYAIAGFLIDLSYLFIGLLAILAHIGGFIEPNISTLQTFNDLLTGHVLAGIEWALAGGFMLIVITGEGISAALGLLTGGITAGMTVIGGGLLIIVVLVFLIVFIVIWARILWMQMKAFISILLLIIASPLILLFGSISSSTFGGFTGWLKNMLANIAVFPTVIVMAFLAHLLFWGMAGHNFFVKAMSFLGCNPLHIPLAQVASNSIHVPGFDWGSTYIGILAAFMILFLIPKTAELIKSAIEGKPFAFGSAIGEAVIAPFAYAGKFASTISSFQKKREEHGRSPTPSGPTAPAPTSPAAPPSSPPPAP